MNMEQTLETNAAMLLNGVMNIINIYEAKWQKTGEKYNIFKVAGIDNKEVIMCRVLADLMNPHGMHCQGSRYLKSFWETIVSKLPDRIALDFEHTRVTTEYSIKEKRRIDITLEDGKVFVPIEVKIGAGDQREQIADYFASSKTKNKNNPVPVLYLTVDGHEPSDFSKAGAGKDSYVLLSFKNDILVWLEACVQENMPEAAIPLQEIFRQLIAAIKPLCGKSEDEEMEDEIYKLITKDDNSVRAARTISGCLDFGEKAMEEFKERIVPLVQKDFPKAMYLPNEEDWDLIHIPLKDEAYSLNLNYDWKSVQIVSHERERNKQVEKDLAQEMFEWTTHHSDDDAHVFVLWGTNRYPFEEPVDEELYLYKLAKEYIERKQETADRIISIAKALENVIA